MRHSKQNRNWNRSLTKRMTLILILGITIGWTVWRCWPSTGRRMKRCVAVVERRSWYELVCDGKTVLYFAGVSADSCLTRPSLQQDGSVLTTYSTGIWINRHALWPSCRGRLVTISPSPSEATRINATKLIDKERRKIRKKRHDLQATLNELHYYLRIHNVHDEGYNTVAQHTSDLERQLGRVNRLAVLLDSMAKVSKPQLLRKTIYTAHYHDLAGQPKHVFMRQAGHSKAHQLILLQSIRRTTPAGASPLSIMPWKPQTDGAALAVGYGGLGVKEMASTKARGSIVPVTLHHNQHDLPAVLGSDGSPVFSTRGRFVGITRGRTVVSRDQLPDLFRKENER